MNAEIVYSSKNVHGVAEIIEAFTDNNHWEDPHKRSSWIVAVDMISEGVDIPNLTHLVYATNKKTVMYFLQSIGRVIRMSKAEGMKTLDEAWIFFPSDPSLKKVIQTLLSQIDPPMVLNDPDSDSDNDEMVLDVNAPMADIDMDFREKDSHAAVGAIERLPLGRVDHVMGCWERASRGAGVVQRGA